ALAACSGQSGQEGVAPSASSAAVAASTAVEHGPRDPAQRAAVSTPAATATTPDSDGMKVTGSEPSRQYLHDLMQQPDFAVAFASMDGADKLPSWVSKGGTSTPAKRVVVDSQSLLEAQACKPHDCPSQKIVLLYDDENHGMQGVLVSDPSPGVDAGISDQAEF